MTSEWLPKDCRKDIQRPVGPAAADPSHPSQPGVTASACQRASSARPARGGMGAGVRGPAMRRKGASSDPKSESTANAPSNGLSPE